jgi:hypothetical protein
LFEYIWDEYLQPQFSVVINKCTLNLSGLNPKFLAECNARVPLHDLLKVADRPEKADKFISLLFRQRLQTLLDLNELYHCEACGKVMTQD